jgi:hypothetical protein
VECRIIGGEAAEKQEHSEDHPWGFPVEEASCQNGSGWGIVEGLSAPSKMVLLVWSTWERCRQDPADHVGSTMSDVLPGRRDRTVESKRVESDVAGERERFG